MSLLDPDRLAAVEATGLGATADPAFDRITALVRALLDVPVSLVSLVDATEQVFPGQNGLAEPVARERRTPLSHSFCRHVVEGGEPLVVVDARCDERVSGSPAVEELDIVAYLGHPLTDESGRVLGSLCAIDSQPRQWTANERALLTELALVAGNELRLRATSEQLRRSVARHQLLQQVGEAVGATLDGHEALARLTRLVMPALGEWCTVGLVDDTGADTIRMGRHAELSRSESVQRVADAQTLAGPEAPHRRAVTTADAVLTAGPDLSALVGVPSQRPPDGVALTVPLGRHGHLTLGRPVGETFTAEDVQHVLEVGRRVGLALENAALYREQRASAEALQRSLLTSPPEPDHLHIVARYVPAGSTAQVGGDWYDAFLQTDGSSVLVVGDVTGHDMQAAGMMGQVRNILRGTVHDRMEPPSQLVGRVDRALQLLGVDTLATLVLARVEQSESERADGLRRLVWTNAGHPPPALIEPDGTVRLLETPGELLVGLDVDAARTDHELVLAPGTTVLLYTDGLVERRAASLEVGLVRLRQALAAVAPLPLPDLCDQLLERLVGSDPEDDVALVGVRLFDPRLPRPEQAGPQRIPDLVEPE